MSTAAMRTMAASLKQKVPAAVHRVLASRRAPTAPADADLDPFILEFGHTLEKIVEQHRKRCRIDVLACATGFSLGSLTFFLGVRQLG